MLQTALQKKKNDNYNDNNNSTRTTTKKKEEKKQNKIPQVLDKRLAPLSYLYTNHAIHKLFRKYATARTEDGKKAITPPDAARMAVSLAEYLEVPQVP